MSNQIKKGFDCEFVEEPPAGLDSSCSICKKILREPHQAVCCGNNMCYGCLNDVQCEENACPVCQTLKGFEIFPNTGVKNRLYGLTVYCDHKNQGCQWTGELGQVDQHLNCNPPQESFRTGCDYTPIQCPFANAGCISILLRKEMAGHLEDEFVNHQHRQANYLTTLVVKMQQIEQKNASLAGENQSLKNENMHLRQTVDEHQSRIQYADQQVTELRETVDKMVKEREKASRTGMAIGPVRIIMEEFQLHKETPEDDWFSPPFWTHPQGYKLCLCVIANGEGGFKGQYVSVLLHMMKGAYDDQLAWPFRGVINVQLVDQEEGGRCWNKEIHITKHTPDEVAGRVTEGERSEKGWGVFQYILHSELEPQYLKNDRLCFQIGEIKLKPHERAESV